MSIPPLSLNQLLAPLETSSIVRVGYAKIAYKLEKNGTEWADLLHY